MLFLQIYSEGVLWVYFSHYPSLISLALNIWTFTSFRSHFHLDAALFFIQIWTKERNVGAGKGPVGGSWLQMCHWHTVPSHCKVIVLSINIRNFIEWNGAEVLQIASINSLPCFLLEYVNSSPSEKTHLWFGEQFTLKASHYRENRQYFNKCDYLMLLARFAPSNTPSTFTSCPRTCNNFLGMWHITAVVVDRSVDLTILWTLGTGKKPCTQKTLCSRATKMGQRGCP